MSKVRNVGVLALLLLVAVSVWFGLYHGTTGDPGPTPDVAEAAVPPRSAPVNLVLLAPLTGENSRFGESMKRGAALATSLINDRHGFAGHPVKLHVVDTRSDVRFTLETARDLLQRLKVTLLIGGFDEEATLGLAELANEAKIPFIYTSNGGMKTCKPGARLEPSDYVWGMGVSPHMSVEPFLVHLADKLLKPESKFKVFYFGNDDESAYETASFVMNSAESLLFPTAGSDFVDVRIGDYFQRIRTMFHQKADLLMLSLNRRALPLFLEQAAKLGVRAEMGVATVQNFEEELLPNLGSTADEVRTISSYSRTLENEENRAFLAHWNKAYPDPAHVPTATAVSVYSAIQLAKAAFDRADSVSPGMFSRGMKDLEMKLPQGPIIVNSINNLLIQPLYAMQVKEGKYEVAEYLGDVSHPGMQACMIHQEQPELAKNSAPDEEEYSEEEYEEPLDFQKMKMPKYRKPKGHSGEGKRDGSL